MNLLRLSGVLPNQTGHFRNANRQDSLPEQFVSFDVTFSAGHERYLVLQSQEL